MYGGLVGLASSSWVHERKDDKSRMSRKTCTLSSRTYTIQLSGGRGVCWEARKAGRSYDLTGFLAILINGPDDHFGRDLSSTRMHGARTFVG